MTDHIQPVLQGAESGWSRLMPPMSSYRCSATKRGWSRYTHGEHEKRTGQRDVDWPSWYAGYIVREQAGEPLPS